MDHSIIDMMILVYGVRPARQSVDFYRFLRGTCGLRGTISRSRRIPGTMDLFLTDFWNPGSFTG